MERHCRWTSERRCAERQAISGDGEVSAGMGRQAVELSWMRDETGELTLGDMMGRSESSEGRGIAKAVMLGCGEAWFSSLMS
jgi:hypothetical protein